MIGRTLFWFKDGAEALTRMSDDFFGFSTLLNRLLNENYTGKRIKFINIYFYTDEYYRLFPDSSKDNPYYYGGHLTYSGSFNLEEFLKLSRTKQKELVWHKALDYLIQSAQLMKNPGLLYAAQIAFKRGIEMNYNPDYKVVECDFVLSEHRYNAAVWFLFKEDNTYAKLIVTKGLDIVFDQEIDKVRNGNEFFLEIYKAIVLENNCIVIKGRKDIEYLPLKIPVENFKI